MSTILCSKRIWLYLAVSGMFVSFGILSGHPAWAQCSSGRGAGARETGPRGALTVGTPLLTDSLGFRAARLGNPIAYPMQEQMLLVQNQMAFAARQRAQFLQAQFLQAQQSQRYQQQQEIWSQRQQRAERTRQLRAERIARAKAQREAERTDSFESDDETRLVSLTEGN